MRNEELKIIHDTISSQTTDVYRGETKNLQSFYGRYANEITPWTKLKAQIIGLLKHDEEFDVEDLFQFDRTECVKETGYFDSQGEWVRCPGVQLGYNPDLNETIVNHMPKRHYRIPVGVKNSIRKLQQEERNTLKQVEKAIVSLKKLIPVEGNKSIYSKIDSQDMLLKALRNAREVIELAELKLDSQDMLLTPMRDTLEAIQVTESKLQAKQNDKLRKKVDEYFELICELVRGCNIDAFLKGVNWRDIKEDLRHFYMLGFDISVMNNINQKGECLPDKIKEDITELVNGLSSEERVEKSRSLVVSGGVKDAPKPLTFGQSTPSEVKGVNLNSGEEQSANMPLSSIQHLRLQDAEGSNADALDGSESRNQLQMTSAKLNNQ